MQNTITLTSNFYREEAFTKLGILSTERAVIADKYRQDYYDRRDS